MNPKHHSRGAQPSGKAASSQKGTRQPEAATPRRRPVHQLFETESEPLDAAASMLAKVRQTRRSPRLWVAAGLLSISVLQAWTQETNTNNIATNATAAPLPGARPAASPDNATNSPEAGTAPSSRTNAATEILTASAPRTNSSSEVATASSPQAAAAPEAPRTTNPQPPGAASRPTPPETTPRASRGKALDYSAFRIINERNIFDPNRYPRRPDGGQRPRPRQVDAFALVGVMSYEKGSFAFFDGSSSQFRKALKAADSIAGFTVASINGNSVKLSSPKKEVELQVGMQLRREDEGEWQLSSRPTEGFASSGPSGPSSSGSPSNPATPASSSVSTPPSGAADEVLKRLMQRREQE